MNDILLVHYSEIGTKGKNRSFFERRLRNDIEKRLGPDAEGVRVESGRVVVRLSPGFEKGRLESHLNQVFGVAWYALAQSVPREWEPILQAGLDCAAAHPAARAFKVYSHRADKTFPLSSQEICNRLGRAVVEKYGLKVDLERHDLAIYVEILADEVFVYSERKPGLRGMPQGSSGRVLCLFSGGIDSPVAAWLLARRGAMVHLLHFHPFRRAEELRDTKIFSLHKQLLLYSPGSRLYLIPHYHFQLKAALDVPSMYEMVLFRRFMFKTAEKLAERRRCKALVTGDSLGQVASQTLENIAAAQADLKIPVFLPLISQDKDDIVRLAQKIGTYDLSIQPYKDCCSLMSRHPKTMMPVHKALELEKKINLDAVVADSLASLELWDGETISAPALSFKNQPLSN